MATDTRETVRRDTATLASAPEADDVDPFADMEEELEENEVVLEDC